MSLSAGDIGRTCIQCEADPPALYDVRCNECLRASRLSAANKRRGKPKPERKPRGFIEEARALAKRHGLRIDQAICRLANDQPDLHRAMFDRPEPDTDSEQRQFVLEARALAQREGIRLDEGMSRLSREHARCAVTT